SGLLSMSGHGNLSLRVTGKDEMLFTAGGSPRDLPPQALVRVRRDGTPVGGDPPPHAHPAGAAAPAAQQPPHDVGCVLHTHSPYATAFAVAGRQIDCWTEAMAIFGLGGGVPLAAYGPRGSEAAVSNIRALLSPETRAVLLANHGVLAFHRSPAETVGVNVVLEEAAQSAIYAAGIGGATVIPPEMIEASVVRASDFARRGTARAG